MKTTTADSSNLPGLSLTAGFPSRSSPVSFWPTHKHTHSQLNLIWFIPLFSEGAEPRHLSLSPRLSRQRFTTSLLLFGCPGENECAHEHAFNLRPHTVRTKLCVCDMTLQRCLDIFKISERPLLRWLQHLQNYNLYHLFISPLTCTCTAFRALAELSINPMKFSDQSKFFCTFFLNIQVEVKPPFYIVCVVLKENQLYLLIVINMWKQKCWFCHMWQIHVFPSNRKNKTNLWGFSLPLIIISGLVKIINSYRLRLHVPSYTMATWSHGQKRGRHRKV